MAPGAATPSNREASDVDAIAHEVAITLLDDITDMDADAKLDAALCWQAGIALDHCVLHFDGAAHGVYNAAKLNQCTIACALHHAPLVHSNGGIDQVAPQRA